MRTKKRRTKPSFNKPTKQVRLGGCRFNPGGISVTKFRVPIRKWERYHDKFLSLSEIKAFLQRMVENYPRKLEVEIVGRSTGGKPIYLAKISGATPNQMATLVEAGSDGADRMAVSAALFLIDFLAKNNSCTRLMDYLILPCSNPDTYHHNGVPTNLSNNFPVTLGLNDVTLQPTEAVLEALRTWKANYKYQAPETAAIIKTFRTHQDRVKLFVSLQERGEKIVYPFGFCRESPSDAEDLEEVAAAGRRAMNCRCFEVGSVFELCGLTYGTVVDFLRTNQRKVKFTYILHLRDEAKRVSPQLIVSYGEGVLRCVKSMARNVYMYYKRSERIE